MKKFLLPEGGSFYKANLHCHTTVSDGKLSPAEVKGAYMSRGYSIVAFTDHNIFVRHNDLTNDRFLALNGYELDATEAGDYPFFKKKTCHFCLIATDPDQEEQVCYHRSKFVWGNAQNYRSVVKFDESKPDFEREYTPECINTMMQEGRDNGFFVTYNHPYWSLESYPEYSRYEHMNAVEISNYSCLCMGYSDYNPHVYDDLLRQGKRIYCVATDDCHASAPFTTRKNDVGGGFTMIKAEKLEYKAVTDALVAGNFYASQGPLINELWFEDGYVHITFSKADRVILNTGLRRAGVEFDESGEGITSASFKVTPDDVYIRLTVIDKAGYHANTNAYFTDELFGDAE